MDNCRGWPCACPFLFSLFFFRRGRPICRPFHSAKFAHHKKGEHTGSPLRHKDHCRGNPLWLPAITGRAQDPPLRFALLSTSSTPSTKSTFPQQKRLPRDTALRESLYIGGIPTGQDARSKERTQRFALITHSAKYSFRPASVGFMVLSPLFQLAGQTSPNSSVNWSASMRRSTSSIFLPRPRSFTT
jgi:hypothetical protein